MANINLEEILIVENKVGLEYFREEYGIEDLSVLVKELRKDPYLDVSDILKEYDSHYRTIEKLVDLLESQGLHYKIKKRKELGFKDLDSATLVLTIGGDGTFLDTAHFILDDKPILGINSYPEKSIGFYLSTNLYRLERDLLAMLNGDFYIEKRRRLKATICDGNPTFGLALNEVFIGKLYSMDMARYMIITDGIQEYQQSSGVVVALREGSTGWLLNIPSSKMFDEEEQRMQFVNREPRNRGRDYKLNRGFTEKLEVVSMDYDLVVSLDSNRDRFIYHLSKGHRVIIETSNNPLRIIKFNK